MKLKRSITSAVTMAKIFLLNSLTKWILLPYGQQKLMKTVETLVIENQIHRFFNAYGCITKLVTLG